jgi:hypothetical protein
VGLAHQSRVVARIRAAGRQGQEKGFALPLALGVSLVLGLSSLSMQTATLQARARLGSTLRLRHSEDALMSAAQQLIGQPQPPPWLPAGSASGRLAHAGDGLCRQ